MRPKKEFKLKRNGDSFQAFEGDVYLGSASAKELCFYIKGKSRAGYSQVKAQRLAVVEKARKAQKRALEEKGWGTR